MTHASRIARIAAAAFALVVPVVAHAVDRCDKNHYILDEPCIPFWTAVNEGLADLDVRVVAVDPLRTTTLYAGGATGVFKSADAGASWRLTGFDLAARDEADSAAATQWFYTRQVYRLSSRVRHLAIDSRNPGTLYAATEMARSCWSGQRRLFRSTDGGETWTDSVSPPSSCWGASVMTIAAHDSSTLYFSSIEWMDGLAPVVRTTNRAATWSYPPFPSANVLAIDPLDARVMYVGTPGFDADLIGYQNGVLKTVDGGETWAVTGLTDPWVSALALHPANPRTLYAIAGWPSALYKSVDGGDNWAMLREVGAFFVTTVLIDSGDSNTVYLATNGGGVSRSLNGGATWAAINGGLPSLVVNSLALVPGSPNTLYAGTPAGVFKATD